MIPLVHGTRGSGRLAKFVANCEPAVKAKQGSRSIALWKFREAVQLFGSIGGKGNLFARSRCSTVTEGRSKGPVSSLITENFVSRRYLVRAGGRPPFVARGEKSWLLCAKRSVRHARALPCIFSFRAKDRG